MESITFIMIILLLICGDSYNKKKQLNKLKEEVEELKENVEKIKGA